MECVSNQYTLLPLFQAQELADDCCYLLNNQWKRSFVASLSNKLPRMLKELRAVEAIRNAVMKSAGLLICLLLEWERHQSLASVHIQNFGHYVEPQVRARVCRMRSLNCTNNRFPLNLILVKNCEGEKMSVIGHCRASAIPPPDSHGPAVFLESVVIAPELRGQGLGRLLMAEVETYLRKRGVRSLYLYTMGQEKFYGKLGYTPCQPVDIFGHVPELNYSPPAPKQQPVRRRSYIGQNGTAPPPPPPPPPPPLPTRIPANERSFYKGSKTFMHKVIFPIDDFRP